MTTPPPQSGAARYEAPQYQTPQPGQQPPAYSAPPPTAAYPVARGNGQAFGIVGAVLAVLGGVAGVLAFTVLPWLRHDSGSPFFQAKSSQTTFGKVHDQLQSLQQQLGTQSSHVHLGVAPTYFSWLAWVLLGVAFVLALLAVAPLGSASGPLRALATLVALAGIGITFWAIDLLTYDSTIARALGAKSPSYTDYLSHGYIAFWCALGGFLLIGIGALTGPRQVTSTQPLAPRPAY